MTDWYEDENCGHCKWHINEDGEWICANQDSDYWGCATEYRDVCNNFEEKDVALRYQFKDFK